MCTIIGMTFRAPLCIYIYIARIASNEIFSPSNKIHREVGRAKDLSAPRYNKTYRTLGQAFEMTSLTSRTSLITGEQIIINNI